MPDKVVTYSKRQPIIYSRNNQENNVKGDQNSDKLEDISLKKNNIVSRRRDFLLQEVSDRIKQLEYIMPASAMLDTPRKPSRKSEVRPRKSIPPSQLEFGLLCKYCEQNEEIPFDEWLSATKWYQTWFFQIERSLIFAVIIR